MNIHAFPTTKMGKSVIWAVLGSFMFTSLPVNYSEAARSADHLRTKAVTETRNSINSMLDDLRGTQYIADSLRRLPGRGISKILPEAEFGSADAIAAKIAAAVPAYMPVEELSFMAGRDGLWAVSPELETDPQVFVLLKSSPGAEMSEGIRDFVKANKGRLAIEENNGVVRILIPVSQPSQRRQMLLQIAATFITEKEVFAGMTYEKPVAVFTPIMERTLLGAGLEREFLDGYKKNTELALEKFKPLDELLQHLKDPKSGAYRFVITKQLAQDWELRERLVKMIKDMAPVAVAGMRNAQNPLFPGDLNSPMNILLALLLSNELAEMSMDTFQKQKGDNEEPHAIVGGEVRYNTPEFGEMFRRRFARLGFTVHSPERGVYLPIGATSYITTVLNIMFTIYDTSSHSARSVYGVKLMGNLRASVSPFLEAYLSAIGIDPEQYKKSRSEGAQLLIEDMVELANRIGDKIDRIYEGEDLVIDLAAGTDANIRFDIDNPGAENNIDVVGKYSEYLRNAYVTKNNRDVVRQAMNNGMQMGFDQTRGAAYRFFRDVYKTVFGKETAENILWTGTMPDSFFGDTGMSDFNAKQKPDEYLIEYVQGRTKEMDDYFKNVRFGTSVLAAISEQALAQSLGKQVRSGKENDIVTVRFRVFAQEEENMLKRFGMPYIRLSSGKLLVYYRPKIADFSQDVSLLEVVINSKLPALMLSKPVGYVHPITDPDGDRFVVAQVERNTARIKERLEKRNIAYIVLSDEKLLAVYVPNQTFLQIQNAYIDQLMAEGKFSQDIEDPNAITWFAIKTTVSSNTWLELYTNKGVPAIQVPVGFKEISAIMRKVELQLLTNEVRVAMGLPRAMVVVHDVMGRPVRLGYNPRLLFAGEESGGMIQGSSDMLRSEDGLRRYLSWREKNAIEASICTTIMLSNRFNEAREKALQRGVLPENLYNDAQFLEDISLSRMLDEIFEENAMRQTAELRADIPLVDPMTIAQADRDTRDRMTKEGIYRRDANFNFFLSLAFALQDGHITLDDVKAILKEAMRKDEAMLARIIAVTDDKAPTDLEKIIDEIARFEFVGDAVRIEFNDQAWQVIRPSGTEPKIKSYPSSDDARRSAIICNAIGEVFPSIFFEMIRGKEVADMPATTAYIKKMLTADPDLIDANLEDTNRNAITLRQRLQYQRGLLVDTVPAWVDNDVQKLLESQELFRETGKGGIITSSVNIFLGPAQQKEALRYDPESKILYVSWDLDNRMYVVEDAQDKIKLFQEAMQTMHVPLLTVPLLSELDYVMRMLKVQDYKRALQILLTSTDSVHCINRISAYSGKSVEEVERAMEGIDAFRPMVADARLRRAQKRYDPKEFTNKELAFEVGAEGYVQTGGHFSAQGGVITEFLGFMRGAVNNIAFAFRDNMERFVNRFLGNDSQMRDAPDLTDILDRLDAYMEQVNETDETKKDAAASILESANYLLSSGIGANEMFSHLRARILNAYFENNNIPFRWIVVNNPSHVKIIPADAQNKNTVVFEMSRSGSTEETRNFAVKTKDRFKQRIGAANKGALNEIEKSLQGQPDALTMIFEDIPEDIGGRQMNRKTLMVYAPLYLALRLGLKDKEKARALLRSYVETSLDSNRRLSYSQESGHTEEAVNAAEFLFRHRESGRTGFAVIYHNELFPLFKEFEQLNNEGANKKTAAEINNNVVIGYSLEDGANMYRTVFDKTGKTQVGIFLLNKNSADYESTVRYVEKLRAQGVPALVFALDLGAPEAMRNNNLEALQHNLQVAERASYLIQDMVVYFTYLTKQDANSNPEVKLVRDITPLNFEGIKMFRAGQKPKIWITFAEVARGLQEKKQKDLATLSETIDRVVENKQVTGQILRRELAGIGSEDFDRFNEAARNLEDALGMKRGLTGLAISESLSPAVFEADLGEAGGNSVPRINAAFAKAGVESVEKRTVREERARKEGLYKELVLNPEDDTMRISLAMDENSDWLPGGTTLAEQMEEYIVHMWKKEIMYIPLMYMDSDAGNKDLTGIAEGILNRFAEWGITVPMLGLPGSAHTGLEGIFSHAKKSFSISVIYTEAFGGDFGQSVVEEGKFPDGSKWFLTVDDMNYGYAAGNVSRMAFGNAPGIVLQMRNKDELLRAKAILDQALDRAKYRIFASTSDRGSNAIPAGLAEISRQMRQEELQKLWESFDSANNAIFSKLSGNALVDLVDSLKIMLQNGTLDRSRQKVILFTEEDSRKPGFYPVLKALRELEKVRVISKNGKETEKPILRLAVYGKDSETIRILAQNPNITVADDFLGVMEILIRDGVRNQDILALPANSAEKLDSREGIRQFMAGDVFTLTAGMALKALFEIRDEARRQAVRQEFARFFDKLAEAGVISSENKEEVVSKTIDTAAFDLPAMVPMQEARRIEVNADIQRATQALADLGV